MQRTNKMACENMYQFVEMNEIVQGSHSTNASSCVCRRLFFLDLLVFFSGKPSVMEEVLSINHQVDQPSRCLELKLGYLESVYNT